MRSVPLILFSILLITLLQTVTQGQDRPPKPPDPPQTQAINHGGKIESSYDGFNHETVLTLRKMKVTCDGFKDKFKGACTSIVVELHCPGIQLNYVSYVTLKILFQSEAWDARHPLDQRDLSVVTDSGTLRFGRMQLAGEDVNWIKVETLERRLPYEAFRKIMISEWVEIQVGQDRFQLRGKNIAALRDLNSRLMLQRSASQ